jgi:hypothetical protein
MKCQTHNGETIIRLYIKQLNAGTIIWKHEMTFIKLKKKNYIDNVDPLDDVL